MVCDQLLCCYKTNDFIFDFSFSLWTCLKENLKGSSVEPYKQADLKVGTLKINDKTQTGSNSAFFFLLCVTKLLKYEFEFGIECFKPLIDSKYLKKFLQKVFSKDGQS